MLSKLEAFAFKQFPLVSTRDSTSISELTEFIQMRKHNDIMRYQTIMQTQSMIIFPRSVGDF